MSYIPEIHHRHSIRLKGYDYSQNGAYFVTICTQNRERLFGEIMDGEMLLNNAGEMVASIWYEIPEHYPGVEIDVFQIMPDHIHGIILLIAEGADPRVCPNDGIRDPRSNNGQPQGVAPTKIPIPTKTLIPTTNTKTLSLPDVVQRFKSLTTKRYIDGVKENKWPPFNQRVWQRNYYERIIRDERAYLNICEYIISNPANWGQKSQEKDHIGAIIGNEMQGRR